jgi:hypothetical protein
VTGEDESIRASYEALERRAAQSRGEPLRRKIADQVAIWRHNRKLYPGWVVAPWSNRALLYNLTSAWIERIVEGSADAQPGEQIIWLRELTWRLDVCLLPLDGRLAHAAEAALKRCGFSDAETSTHPQRSLRHDVEVDDCIALAASLLRHYREQGDVAAFEKHEARLLPIATATLDLRSHLVHERILLHLGRLEHAKAGALLAAWPQPVGSPIWAIRRAALMAETGDPAGPRLVQAALSTLQDALPRGPVYEATDFHLLSCEGWAIKNVVHMGPSVDLSTAFDGRLEELGAVHCDPFTTLERLNSILDIVGPRHRPRRSVFDEPSGFEYALQACRLIEVGGRIVRLGNEIIGGSLLEAAASWIVLTDPGRAIPILLRMCDPEKLEKALDADVVSRLSASQIAQTFGVVRGALAEAAPHINRARATKSDYRSPRAIEHKRIEDQAQTALAGLRALSPRLSASALEEMVRDCSALRRNWRGGAWQVRKALDESTSVGLRSMSAEQRSGHTLDLIEQTLAGKDPEVPAVLGWQNDPIRLLLGGPSADRSREPKRWREAVESLIHEIETTNNDTVRADGLMRCVVLHQTDSLDARERERLATAIWRPEGLVAKFTLPSRFLMALPEVQTGQAARVLRSDVQTRQLPRFALDINGERKWRMNPGVEYDLLINVLSVSRTPFDGRSVRRLGQIEWQSNDVEDLVGKIETWWREEGGDLYAHLREPSPLPGPGWRFTSIVETLAYVVIPNGPRHAPRAAKLLRSLADAGVEVALASPLLALEDPSRITEIATALRDAMASKNDSSVVAAYGGAFLWFEDNGGALPQMPFDFPREISSTIYGRRRPGLATALHFAALLMESHATRITAAFHEDIRIGLRHLRNETAPGRQNADDGAANERAIERSLAIDLLIAYSANANSRDDTVCAWFDEAEREPFNANNAKLVAAKDLWDRRHRDKSP